MINAANFPPSRVLFCDGSHYDIGSPLDLADLPEKPVIWLLCYEQRGKDRFERVVLQGRDFYFHVAGKDAEPPEWFGVDISGLVYQLQADKDGRIDHTTVRPGFTWPTYRFYASQNSELIDDEKYPLVIEV